MPRHPGHSDTVSGMPPSVYSALAHRLASHEGEIYPLHVGDTHRAPAEGCRVSDFDEQHHPGLHRYAPVQGHSVLLDAIIDVVGPRMGLPISREELLVTAGATAGLGAIIGATVNPGDEVLILAPFWPLIAGIVKTFKGVPVPVPFVDVATDAASAAALVRAAITERTVAIYWNTPNNPTGRLIPAGWLTAMVEVARAHDLWIIADEVYEHYAFAGPHQYTRPLAPERTFSAHSFSKAYGMAGNRCGFIIAPEASLGQLKRISTHTYYSAPTVAQYAAAAALRGPGDAWAAEAAEQYTRTGRMAAERLGLVPPEGSTFLFFDVAEHLDERGLEGLLSDCVDDGLLVAPGSAFGPYPTHVRLCFTAAPHAVVMRGVEGLAKRLGR